MTLLDVQHIAKSFGSAHAVVDVSFEVSPGEIFGLLGPNGAGKTTTIRMILDLFKPDQGAISVLGGPMNEAKKSRLGYMPEERGLYQDMPLEACLVYLGTLKGLPEREARRRLEDYLERFELAGSKNKKVKELSKGMQQKAQIISTILHHPDLIIVDEPFTALDPLNLQLVKQILLELRQQGVAVVMSTHQMHTVEELCDRILLINQGRAVLYGALSAIQHDFAGHAVWVRSSADLAGLPGVSAIQSHNHAVKLVLEPGATPQQVFKALAARDTPVEMFEIALPTLDEIFIRVVEGGAGHE